MQSGHEKCKRHKNMNMKLMIFLSFVSMFFGTFEKNLSWTLPLVTSENTLVSSYHFLLSLFFGDLKVSLDFLDRESFSEGFSTVKELMFVQCNSTNLFAFLKPQPEIPNKTMVKATI